MKCFLFVLAVFAMSNSAYAAGEIVFSSTNSSGSKEISKYISNADDTEIQTQRQDSPAEVAFKKAADGSWSGVYQTMNIQTSAPKISGQKVTFSVTIEIPGTGMTMVYNFVGSYGSQGQFALSGSGKDKDQLGVTDVNSLVFDKTLVHTGDFKMTGEDFHLRTFTEIQPTGTGYQGSVQITEQSTGESWNSYSLEISNSQSLEMKTLMRKDPILFTLIYGIDWLVYLDA